ncbi:hypothetical protein LEMLEM_LOCUS20159 [Lemmus lemmus]
MGNGRPQKSTYLIYSKNSQGRAFLSIVGQAFRSCGELFEESLGSELLNRKGQDFSNQCCACS